MDSIYLIALEITISLILMFLFPVRIALLIGIMIIGTVFIFSRKKERLLIILPLLFLLRGAGSLNFTQYKKNDIITVETQIYRSRGKIEKINNKIPTSSSYVHVNDIPDGNHIITGKIKNINERYHNIYYELESPESTQIPDGKIKSYFNTRASSLLKNSGFRLEKLYRAIILGENAQLPKDIREKFSYTGISHLIALSGFHVGVIITIASCILGKLPFSKRFKNIFLLLFLTIYYLGVEHSPSLTRAYIMGGIYLLGNILYENTDLMKSLTVAYIISLFINPMEIMSISFKLSYCAVFIIGGIYPLIIKITKVKKSKFIKGIVLIFTIQIFLAPVVLNEFGTLQLLSFLSNIAVVPLGSLFITLSFIGLLLENISLGFIIMPLINFSYFIFMKAVDLFAKIPYMSIDYSRGYQSTIFYFYYFGILITILYINGKKEKRTDEKLFKRTEISQ